MAGPVKSTAVNLAVVNDAATQDASEGFASAVTFQLVGNSWTGVVTFEGTVDGTNWSGVGATQGTDRTVVATANGNGIFTVPSTGMTVRVRLSTATAGSVDVYRQPTIG